MKMFLSAIRPESYVDREETFATGSPHCGRRRRRPPLILAEHTVNLLRSQFACLEVRKLSSLTGVSRAARHWVVLVVWHMEEGELLGHRPTRNEQSPSVPGVDRPAW
jgi:hypothetical protein